LQDIIKDFTSQSGRAIIDPIKKDNYNKRLTLLEK